MRKKTEKSENAETFDLADNSAISSILEKLGGVVRVDDVLDRLNKALAELGHINLIIAGKSGVGKSTLINSVFRQDVADTGVGKPFTKEMTLYEREDVPLRIMIQKVWNWERMLKPRLLTGSTHLFKTSVPLEMSVNTSIVSGTVLMRVAPELKTLNWILFENLALTFPLL